MNKLRGDLSKVAINLNSSTLVMIVNAKISKRQLILGTLTLYDLRNSRVNLINRYINFASMLLVNVKEMLITTGIQLDGVKSKEKGYAPLGTFV